MGTVNLVVGCGFAGSVIARKIAEEAGQKVVIIDKREHIAGNSYDYRDHNGIMIHKYGSHIFHTGHEDVWHFLNRFTSFNTYMHEVVGIVDGIEAHIPFNFNTLYQVFPSSMASVMEEKLLKNFEYNKKVPILEFMQQDDPDLKFLAQYVYEKIFLHYTCKQWGSDPDSISGAVTARVPVYLSKDNRYFQDKYQGIPLIGYTGVIEKILDHPNIEVILNTPFKDYKGHWDRLFYTGSIDEYMDYQYGVLPYRSVNFKFEEHDREFYQSHACINYPCNYDFTRIHEYKHYLQDRSARTVIAKEYSEDFKPGCNERYYPVISEENQALYQRYKAALPQNKKIYFLGRLGDYRYYNMDEAVKNALDLFNMLEDK